MSTTTTTPAPAGTDHEALEARLNWLAGAGSEDDVRLIERALLAETDNGVHEGDPEQGETA